MSSALTWITAFPWWEPCAVILGVIYLLLAAKENIWCWPAGFMSTLIFMFLFWDATLVMQSALQCYYLGMAVYGWWNWREQESGEHLQVSRFTTWQHIAAMAVIAIATLTSTYLLNIYAESARPLLDSTTTWAAVITTWMVTRKILDNWLYWIVIDILSAYLYFDRGLLMTAVLYVAYSIIAVAGYVEWKKQLSSNNA